MHPFPSLIRVILFDFDFTLVDAGDGICQAFRTCLSLPDLPDARIRKLIGLPLDAMINALMGYVSNEQMTTFVNSYRAAFAPLCLDASKPEPGAKYMLRSLSRQVKIGLVTSRKTDGAICMLQAHQMLDAFDVLVGLEHVKRAKPAADPVLAAVKHLGVSTGHAVMVGDTPHDIQSAIAAGAGAVGVATGAFERDELLHAGAHLVVDSLTQLPAVLKANASMQK